MPEYDDLIAVSNLRKTYGATVAVADVSLTVRAGEIFGILGPNGAGKTTTVESIAGLRTPDGGTIRVLGLDPRKHRTEITSLVGVQLQASELPDRIKTREALELYASFYPSPADPADLLERLGLTKVRDTAFAKLSGGQKQRLSIALALIGNPKIAILDELTTGLDPQARRDTWELVKQIRDSGVTIILVTHFMEEAEYLCDRIAIIDGGAIVAEGTPAALKRSIAGEVVTVSVADNADKAAEVLTEQACVRSADVREDGGLRLSVDVGETAMPQIMRALADVGIELATIELHRPTLDDVFLTKTGRSLRES
jgi:ABC-2 type transport system ATP-binding protein